MDEKASKIVFSAVAFDIVNPLTSKTLKLKTWSVTALSLRISVGVNVTGVLVVVPATLTIVGEAFSIVIYAKLVTFLSPSPYYWKRRNTSLSGTASNIGKSVIALP